MRGGSGATCRRGCPHPLSTTLSGRAQTVGGGVDDWGMDAPIRSPEAPAGPGPPGRGRAREVADPFVVAPPSGVRIRTRLRPTDLEAATLTMIGNHLGHLYRTDVAGRVALGRVPAAGRGRTERKRNLTALSSSRVGRVHHPGRRAMPVGLRGLVAEVAHLRAAATRALQRRIAVPVGEKDGKVRG